MNKNRKNERCIVCKKPMNQGSSASWCPDSHKRGTDHYYAIEHNQYDETIGEKLLSGIELALYNSASKGNIEE